MSCKTITVYNCVCEITNKNKIIQQSKLFITELYMCIFMTGFTNTDPKCIMST